jgi:alkylation response protein AidB-like acyl-CoA dehydrogenase
MTGDADFNEVFLDNVRVPAKNIVGKRGQGWIVSRSTLKHERALIGNSALTRRTLDGVIMMAQALHLHGQSAIKDPHIRNRIIDSKPRCWQQYHGYRLLTMQARPRPGSGLVGKLYGTTLSYDIV